MKRAAPEELLLGEWACLGVLYPSPMHGFAVAAQLAPTAEIGRVWSLSRPLTYRSLDQLQARGFIAPIGRAPGTAGPNRTMLAATRVGRARLRAWARTPVDHLRDVRSELLLKLVLASHCTIEVSDMLRTQLQLAESVAASLQAALTSRDALGLDESGRGEPDPVALWRSESAAAAVRFLQQLQPP